MGLKTIDPRHRILKIPPIHHTTTTKLHILQGHGFNYAIGVHANCPCNELVSLHNRHLVDRTMIPFDANLWRRVTRSTIKYYPVGLTPVAYEDIIADYSGGKRRLYTNARHVLLTEGLQPKHFIIKMFVKPDRYPLDTIEKKAPRAIQYRSPEFNLVMGKYIKAYERELYGSLTMGSASQTRVIAKGLNNYDRAELFLRKVDAFRNPRYLLLDHSQFDSTINVEHLKATHRRYQRAFASRTLQRCLKAQLKNTGYTKCGIKYRTRGTRMSGDPDTACGNSIVNAECLHAFLVESGVTKFDFLLDGDDSIVIVEATDIQNLDMTLFGRLGFQTKCEIVQDLDEVEFCQCKLIFAQRPVFSRNPARALSHSAASRQSYPNHHWRHWLAAVGSCEMACNLGVPVLQEYGRKLKSLSSKYLVDIDMQYRWESYEQDVAPMDITEDARLSFCLAWGVNPIIQQMLEQFDYTSTTYWCSLRYKDLRYLKSVKSASNVLQSMARKTWALRNIYQSIPESSSGCWWRSGQNGYKYPSRCCL